MSRLDWARDGADWPLREASRFVDAGEVQWHVQVMGSETLPRLFLVHGTGAATHSWRGLLPLLAREFCCLSVDLPGHGFSSPLPAQKMSLAGISAALGELLKVQRFAPDIGVGHSAGAAILARMALDHVFDPDVLVSLNGALLPLPGVLGHVFSPMAKLLALNPFAPKLVAWRALDAQSVSRLIAGTGSRLDEHGTQLYSRLVQNPEHVRAVLDMLAGWDLHSLERDLPRLEVPVTLVAADQDRTVPPVESARVARMLKRARVIPLPGLGHLAHEEDPAAAARIIASQFRREATHHARAAGSKASIQTEHQHRGAA